MDENIFDAKYNTIQKINESISVGKRKKIETTTITKFAHKIINCDVEWTDIPFFFSITQEQRCDWSIVASRQLPHGYLVVLIDNIFGGDFYADIQMQNEKPVECIKRILTKYVAARQDKKVKDLITINYDAESMYRDKMVQFLIRYNGAYFVKG